MTSLKTLSDNDLNATAFTFAVYLMKKKNRKEASYKNAVSVVYFVVTNLLTLYRLFGIKLFQKV